MNADSADIFALSAPICSRCQAPASRGGPRRRPQVEHPHKYVGRHRRALEPDGARTLAAEAALCGVGRALELAGGKGFYRIAGLERRLRVLKAARSKGGALPSIRAKEQQALAGRMALGVPIDGPMTTRSQCADGPFHRC